MIYIAMITSIGQSDIYSTGSWSFKFSEFFKWCFAVAVSGIDNDLILGRLFGGCGIIYRKSLAPFIRRIYSPSKRFCQCSWIKQRSRIWSSWET